MSGIIFLRTKDLKGMVDFYTRVLEMDIWLEQAECSILKHGNMLLGFCEGIQPETEGVITFFYDHDDQVDHIYNRTKDTAESSPKVNDRYRIYHFYFRDPEGRILEAQRFLHDLPPIQ